MDLPNQCHLAVGLPFCGRPVSPKWALDMMTMSYPMAANLMMFPAWDMEIGEARNAIVEKVLEVGAKYLWFVDDDTAPPSNAIQSLKYEMEQHYHDGVRVVGGIYCSKSDIPEPIVFRGSGQGTFWDWKAGDVFECDGIGTGCMLISTDIFREIEKPWFLTVDGPRTENRFQNQQTDDLYFCDKVKAAGYKILAHGGVLCEHLDAATRTSYVLRPDSFPMKVLA